MTKYYHNAYRALVVVLYIKFSWFLSSRFPLKNQVLYLSELSSKFIQHVKYIRMGRLVNSAG